MECDDKRVLQLNIKDVLLFAAIVLIPIQDFFLYKTSLHSFGRYLSNVPLTFLTFYCLFELCFYKKCSRSYFYKYSLGFIYFVVWSLIMSAWTGTDLEFSVRKTVSQGIVFLYCVIFYECSKNSSIVYSAINYAFIVNFFGFVLCDLLGVITEGVFHSVTYGEISRFQGLTPEASWFCFTSAVLGMLVVWSNTSNTYRMIVASVTLYIVSCGGSKGTLICCFLTLLLYISTCTKMKTKYRLLLLFIGIVMSVVVADLYLIYAISTDLTDATSFSTRCALDIAYLITFFYYPLGTGVSGAITIVTQNARGAFDLLQENVPMIVLKDRELLESISRPDGSGVLVANMFLIMLCYFGVVFLVIFMKKFINARRLLLQNNDFFLYYILLFVIIGNMTYANFGYESIIMFSIIAKEKMRRINNEKI